MRRDTRHGTGGAGRNETDGIDFARLPDYIGYRLRLAQAAVFRDFPQIMKGIGLTPGEFSLLTLIGANPDINQSTLARIYGLDKSTLSYAVKDLARRRLIRQTRSARDRRRYGITLTEAGRSVLRRATARVEGQERAMDRFLAPGERATLLDMLGRLSRAFET
jgi:DNA-binding MarR family transcriptional regulator